MFACKTSSREAEALHAFGPEIMTRSRGRTAAWTQSLDSSFESLAHSSPRGELKGFSSSNVRTPTFQSDESQEGATVWASEGEEEREERGQSERQMGEGACGARRGAPRPGDLPPTAQRIDNLWFGLCF